MSTLCVVALMVSVSSLTVTLGEGHCVYKDVTYQVGAVWEDGCDYRCHCEDDTGKYTCIQRCPSYLPGSSCCKLVPDPLDRCCMMPLCIWSCQSKTSTAPKTTIELTTTPVPVTTQSLGCYFKGVSYHTGDTWCDGCEYFCTCVRADIGFYKCQYRCQNVSSSATPTVSEPMTNGNCLPCDQCRGINIG